MLEFFNFLVVVIRNSKDLSGNTFIKSYRNGFQYDLNTSVKTDDDYTGQNLGTLYPSLLLDIVGSIRETKNRFSVSRVSIVLSDLMDRDNNGNNRTRTPLEVRNDLEMLWHRLYQEVIFAIEQQKNVALTVPAFQITSDFEINFEYGANSDNLLNMYIDFDISYSTSCKEPASFDYAAAAADTLYPFPAIGRFDYSNPFYDNDTNPEI